MLNNIWEPKIKPETEGEEITFKGVPEIIGELLRLRGAESSEQAEKIVDPSLKDLTSPFKLHDMDKAVARLVQAYEEQQKVYIYADFDLDGTPGLALLKSGLEFLGFENVKGYQPKRISEGYGVHKEAIDTFDADLIITVDVGITDIEAVDYANSKGIDVIVTDHHQPKEQLPNAVAVVNPNKGFCDSGLSYLCGAGVAFYLVLALRSEMKKLGILEKDFNPKELLDVFAIGTITDLVPMLGDNRVLVKHGLVVLENTKRVGLRALLKALKLDGRPLTASDVGLRFSPKLNALSRMEAEILPIDLFTETDPKEADRLVRESLRINERRLELQRAAEKEAAEMAKAFPQKGYVWVCSPNFHKGVIGLVATKLAGQFGVPAFVGSVDQDGKISGSSRVSAPGQNVLAALEASSEVLEKFGGHEPAAGFEVLSSNIESFDKCLEEHFESIGETTDAEMQATYYYDTELELQDINQQLMGWIDHLGPFGQEFEQPRFLIKNVNFKNIRELKGGHLKFDLKNRGSQLSALWFFPPQKVLDYDFAETPDYDLLVETQWNYFAGRKSMQLIVKDMKISS